MTDVTPGRQGRLPPVAPAGRGSADAVEPAEARGGPGTVDHRSDEIAPERVVRRGTDADQFGSRGEGRLDAGDPHGDLAGPLADRHPLADLEGRLGGHDEQRAAHRDVADADLEDLLLAPEPRLPVEEQLDRHVDLVTFADAIEGGAGPG